MTGVPNIENMRGHNGFCHAVRRQAVALSQSQALPVIGALLHGSCMPNQRFGQLLKRRTLQNAHLLNRRGL